MSLSASSSMYPGGSSTAGIPQASSYIPGASSVIAGTSTNTLSTVGVPSATPSDAAYPCPTNNNTIFVDSGYSYTVECGVSYNYQDIISLKTVTFMACMEACSTYTPADGKPSCVAVSWVAKSSTCYRHGKGFEVSFNLDVDSAALQGYSPIVAASSSSIIASSSSSTYLATSTPAPVLPPVLTPVSSSTSTIPNTVVTPSNAPSPCPSAASGYVYYEQPTKPYIIECGVAFGGRNGPNVNATTFIACMDACSNYAPAPPGDSFDEV